MGWHTVKKLPRPIWGVGFVTLCLNLSSIIVFSLSPLYLTQRFGISRFSLGILEGSIEFIALGTRIIAGFICDAMVKRKPLLLIAVGLSFVSRPLFPLANNIFIVFLSRSIERVANGLQATPREALIGDFAPPKLRGSAYGLRESLGKMGSFLGAGIAMIWLLYNVDSLYEIFWFTCIPPLLGLILLILIVHDKPQLVTSSTTAKTSFKVRFKEVFSYQNITSLKQNYWIVVLISFMFMLSNYSGAFVILQGKHVTQLDIIAPLSMVLQNGMAMMTALPIGRLFDRYSHTLILGIGFCIVIVANIVFIMATNMAMVLLGAGLWGIQLAMTQSLLVAKIAINSQEKNRGTAFALYYLAIGIAFLIANSVMGKISDSFSLGWGFGYSLTIAVIALGMLPLLKLTKSE